MNQTHIDSTGAGRGSLKSYATGFILSIVLTVIPFALVMSGALSRSAVLFGIFARGHRADAGAPALLPAPGHLIGNALERDWP